MVKGMDVPANKKNCLLYRTAVFQDENRFSTCRTARLDLKRAVKARLIITKIPGTFRTRSNDKEYYLVIVTIVSLKFA
jgi:hypothetical protein